MLERQPYFYESSIIRQVLHITYVHKPVSKVTTNIATLLRNNN